MTRLSAMLRSTPCASVLLCASIALSGCEQNRPLIKVDPASDAETVGLAAAKHDPSLMLSQLVNTAASGSDAYRIFASGIIEMGSAAAPITLTVFTEYHCGYCHAFRSEHLPRLQEEFIDKQLLRVRFVPSIIAKYPNGPDALKGLLCATDQGSGRAMDDLLVSRPSRHRSSLTEYATELGLDGAAFSACLDSVSAEERKNALMQAAKDLDVTLYTTFFVHDEKIVGLPLYADLRGEIEAAIDRR